MVLPIMPVGMAGAQVICIEQVIIPSLPYSSISAARVQVAMSKRQGIRFERWRQSNVK
jgi:hypothetical protein